MKKKEAIKILQRQLSKIDNRVSDDAWIFQTAEYIRQFFGEQSTQYSFISQFQFTVKHYGDMSDDDIRYYLKEN